MSFKGSVKLLISLILFTSIALLSHRFGFLDISLPIPNNLKINDVKDISSIDVTHSYLREENGFDMECRLGVVSDNYSWCGVGINLTDSLNKGMDFSHYDSVHFEVSYHAPMPNPKFKISFRNFHPNYSNKEDATSLKFNSLAFDSSKYFNDVALPLDIFQVENWWIDQYGIGFEDSHVDLTNVSRIEFLTYNMPVTGVYHLKVKNVELRGEFIELWQLCQLIFCVWLLAGLIVLIQQHYKLQKLSNTDVLTGLYNRRGIQKAVRSIPANHEVCLFYIDINEFKKINDTYGYDVADDFLIYFSRLIEKRVNQGKHKCFLSRFSGDEFILAFDNIKQADILSLAYLIITEFKQPVRLSSYNISVSISLGIAKAPQEKGIFDILLARSGAAMLHVKGDKFLSFQQFDDSFSKSVYFKKQVSEFIKNALLKDEFYLCYMPIYETKSLTISGFEVLLRSQSKEMEGVGPDVFIPIAEEYNLIREIDLWVIENTFKGIKQNFDFLKDHPAIFYINISSDELRNPYFKTHLEKLIKRYDVPAEWIKLELTETSFVETDRESINSLNEIRSLGVRLSLDDFGTGYISFNQLVHYPVNSLKIDKSFVDLLETESQSSEMIVKTIISMADSYQLDTVAEGIETADQYAYLLELGCDFMQGYLFSEPLLWPSAKVLLEEPDSERLRELVKDKLSHDLIPS